MATIDIAMESTSQQILNAITSSGGSGYSSGMKTFTSSGTFVVPDGVGVIYVTACGGGGGGGCVGGSTRVESTHSATYVGAYGGGGGGAGECVYDYPLIVTPGQSLSISIGSGGKGGKGLIYYNISSAKDYVQTQTPTQIATAGGSTSIGNLLTLKGGQAGMYKDEKNGPAVTGGTSDYANGGNGYALTTSASANTTTEYCGKDSGMRYPIILGYQGSPTSSKTFAGGTGYGGGGGGGASIFGVGARGATSATNYGAGGGGGGGINPGNLASTEYGDGSSLTIYNGGDGKSGRVTIRW